MREHTQRDFLSLKWKLFCLLAVVFFFIALGVTWGAKLQQENQLQRERQQQQQRSSQALHSQIRSVQTELVRQTESLVVLAEGGRDALTTDQLVAGIRSTASKQMLLAGVETLQVSSESSVIVYSSGPRVEPLDSLNRLAQEREQPVTRFSCSSECQILAAVPVLLQKGTGSVAVATSIADVVLNVTEFSGSSIGILLAGNDDKYDLDSWALDLSALTHRAQFEPMLQKFSRLHPFSGAGQYLIEQDESRFELAITPITLLEQQRGYWLLLTDVTDSHQSILRNNLQLLMATWLALLISALLLAVLMQPSLGALSLIRHCYRC